MINEHTKVMVKNTARNRVGLVIPELGLNIRWEKPGAIKPIDFGKLEQAMYDPGVDYMFKTGMLYIEDMEVKKALYLEEEDAEEPQNIIVLDDAQRKRYLTLMPFAEFKQNLDSLSNEQLNALVSYAIDNECSDMSKCEELRLRTGIDAIEAMRLNRADKEAQE